GCGSFVLLLFLRVGCRKFRHDVSRMFAPAKPRPLFRLALALLLAASVVPAQAATPRPLAVVSFGFVDTSSEPSDQTAVHKTRLQAMMKPLQDKLAASGRFRILAVACTPEPCSGDADVERELADAKAAGAEWALLGTVDKTSTLILSMPIQVLDVR